MTPSPFPEHGVLRNARADADSHCVAGANEIAIDMLRPYRDLPPATGPVTGIADAGERAKADLHWENIPVAQGAFQARDLSGSIEGRLYGTDDREVGGIFERDRLIGAFGASR